MKRTKVQNDQIFVLKDEVYPNAVIPSLKKEMWRKIDMLGKVHVQGGVFGGALDVDGQNILVEESVYIKDDIHIKGKIWFNSPVSAGQSVLIEESAQVRFAADIHSTKIKLYNAIVYGNIFCDKIIIENSVILGGVYAKSTIKSSNSILGTYNTPHIEFDGNMGMIFNLAISNNKPQLKNKLFSLFNLSYDNSSKVNLFPISSEDIFEINDDVSKSKKYIISPSLRIFDLSEYEKTIKKNLEKIAYISSLKIDKQDKFDKILSDFDNIFFNIINNNFETSPKPQYSKFMNISSEEINDYLEDSEENIDSMNIVNGLDDGPEIDREEELIQTAPEVNGSAGEFEEDDKSKDDVCDLDEKTKVGSKENDPQLSEEEMANESVSEAKPEISVERKCPNCNVMIEDEQQKFCRKCGTPL